MKNTIKTIAALSAMAIITTSGLSASAKALLKIGSRGAEVSEVQQELLERGYFDHEVTGYYGGITKSAVIDFQEDNNILVDGIVGPQTRGKLFGSSSETDIYWLSRIIQAEAGGESYEGKVAVGNSVLNRVKSSQFPNTVKEVIFDRKYGVQYTPVANNTIYNTPDSNSIKAARDALSGVNYIGECMYFYNPRKSTSSWIAKNRPYYTTIGNHDFHL